MSVPAPARRCVMVIPSSSAPSALRAERQHVDRVREPPTGARLDQVHHARGRRPATVTRFEEALATSLGATKHNSARTL